jgi:hypothetical protein
MYELRCLNTNLNFDDQMAGCKDLSSNIMVRHLMVQLTKAMSNITQYVSYVEAAEH